MSSVSSHSPLVKGLGPKPVGKSSSGKNSTCGSFLGSSTRLKKCVVEPGAMLAPINEEAESSRFGAAGSQSSIGRGQSNASSNARFSRFSPAIRPSQASGSVVGSVLHPRSASTASNASSTSSHSHRLSTASTNSHTSPVSSAARPSVSPHSAAADRRDEALTAEAMRDVGQAPISMNSMSEKRSHKTSWGVSSVKSNEQPMLQAEHASAASTASYYAGQHQTNIDDFRLGESALTATITTTPSSSSSAATSDHEQELMDDELEQDLVAELSESRRNRQGSLVTSKLMEIDVKFSMNIFLIELFYHLFFPFSVPVALLVDGLTYTRNHRFLNMGGLFQIFWAGLLTSSNVIYFGWQRHADTNVTLAEIIMANVLFFVHKVMVATKYAFMSPDTLQEMHEVVLPRSRLEEFELLGGWQKLRPDVCKRELAHAGQRVGFMLDKIYFHLRHTAQEVETFYTGFQLDPEMISELDRDHVLPPMFDQVLPSELDSSLVQTSVVDALQFIVMQVFNPSPKVVRRQWLGAVTIGLLMGAFPHFVREDCRYFAGSSSSPSAATAPMMSNSTMASHYFSCTRPLVTPTYPAMDIYVPIAASFVTVFFMTVANVFVMIGVYDYLRRAKLLAALQMMIDPAPLPPHLRLDIVYRNLPQNMLFFDLSIYQNILSWFIARQTVQVFGVEFRNRITSYVSYLFVAIIILLIVLASTLVARVPDAANGIGLDGETKTLLLCVFFAVSVMVLSVLVMLHFASKGNDSYHHHRGTLSRVQMAIRERMAEVGGSHRNNRELMFSNNFKSCDVLIESVLSLLEADDQLNPVSVVGIRATPQLQVLLISVMLSLLTVGVRLVTGTI